MTKAQRKKQAKKILNSAKSAGVEENFFFTTTFERYLNQLEILDQLSEAIKEDGMTVEKEYVKNRKNVYTNPAVKEYNSTTDSANKTVSALIRIIKSFDTSKKTIKDPLADIINGDSDE